jgi:thioredoxin 1
MSIPAKGNVVVKFGADWCGPCRNLKPILEELKKENEGVDFIDINVDDDKDLSAKYGVRGIPAVFFIKDGEQKTSIVGLKDKREYQEHINLLLE